GVEQWPQRFAARFEGRPVDDETRRDLRNVFDRHQLVGLERVAGGNQVDDGVGQTHQGGQFHRTVELDQVDVYALFGKVLACGAQVLGGDTQACALTHRRLVVKAFAHGHAQAAAGDVQIDRLIKTAGVGGSVFIQHVAPGNAEIRGTVLHIRGY